MERRDTLRSISELVEESLESGYDPIGRVAVLTSEVSEPYNVAYQPLERPSNPCPPNSIGNSHENIRPPKGQQVRQGKNLVPPGWARPLYSKANGIKKNSKHINPTKITKIAFIFAAMTLIT